MDRNVARLGSWSGWLAFAGILGYHVALVVMAGQRVSGTGDLAAIKAYYAQPIVAAWGVEQFLVLVPVAIFAVAMREALATGPMARLLTGVALVAVVAELPLIVTEIAAQAALVTAVASGESVAGLFRFWDVLYNSGAYILEATWVLAFGLALRDRAAFPGFMAWLSPLTALLLFINVFAIWVGIPDGATLPSAIAIAAWLVGASIGLGRLAAGHAATSSMATADAS